MKGILFLFFFVSSISCFSQNIGFKFTPKLISFDTTTTDLSDSLLVVQIRDDGQSIMVFLVFFKSYSNRMFTQTGTMDLILWQGQQYVKYQDWLRKEVENRIRVLLALK